MQKNKYFDKIYLSKEECDKINRMNNNEKNEYLKEHNLASEISSTFNNEYKYYKIQYWNISDEELILLTTIDNNKKINTLRILMILIFLLLGLPTLFYFIYTLVAG